MLLNVLFVEFSSFFCAETRLIFWLCSDEGNVLICMLQVCLQIRTVFSDVDAWQGFWLLIFLKGFGKDM